MGNIICEKNITIVGKYFPKDFYELYFVENDIQIYRKLHNQIDQDLKRDYTGQ